MTAGRTINTSSQSRCTPQKYVDAVKNFFGGTIELDPCSNEFSIVKAQNEYILPHHNGLTDSWDFKSIYVNPPYGRDKETSTSIKDRLRRCSHANEEYKSEVIALIPVATNTKHRKEYIFTKATAVCFLADTRLKFLVDGKYVDKGAPMACSIIYWGHQREKFFKTFQQYGAIVFLDNLKDIGRSSPDIIKKPETLSIFETMKHITHH